MTEDTITARDGVEQLISRMAGDNRFDKLVDIRDAAQALITEERDQEAAKLKAENAELAARLSASRARERNLDKVAKAQKPRAPRTPKPAKVPAITSGKKKAAGTQSAA